MHNKEKIVIEARDFVFEIHEKFVYVRNRDVTFYCDVTIANEPAMDCWRDSDPEE